MKNIAVKLTFVFILIFSFSFTNQVFAQNSNTISNSAANYVFTSRLSQGSRGTGVCALQTHLIKAGYLKIAKPTCIFGPLTAVALKNFQQNYKIAPIGSVGPQTRALLNNLNTANNSTNTNANTSNTTTTNNNTNTTTSSNTTVSNSTSATSNTTSVPNTPNTQANTCTNSTPTLTVVYPNGGEVFSSGSQVNAKWDFTCPNLLPAVSIFLEYSNPALPSFIPTVYQILLNTPNDGIETITLPFINQASQAGAFYTLTITDGNAPYTGNPLPVVFDSSNAPFTIQ